MKSPLAITDDENNEERIKKWPALLRSWLLDGQRLSVSETAIKIYGEDSPLARIHTQGMFCAQRSRLETKNGQQLVCRDGLYGLAKGQKMEKNEVNLRTLRAESSVESQLRAIDIMVAHTPQLLIEAEDQVLRLAKKLTNKRREYVRLQLRAINGGRHGRS